MKKIVVVISVLVMSLVLVSCGGSADDASDTKEKAKAGWKSEKIFTMTGEVKTSWSKGVDEGMNEDDHDSPITFYSNDDDGTNEIIIYNSYFERTETEEDVINQVKEDLSENWASYEVSREENWSNENIEGYLIKADVSGGGIQGIDSTLLIFGKGYYYQIQFSNDLDSKNMTEEDFTKFIDSLREQTDAEQAEE